MSAFAGPLIGASPINGLTATTYFFFRASFMPSHSSIGDMLVTGFDGPRITISALLIALIAFAVALGDTSAGIINGFFSASFESFSRMPSLKVLTTFSIGTVPRYLTQYSWK